MAGFLLALLLDAAAVVLTCLAVRFTLPTVVRAGQRAALRAVLGVVAVFLLPEWLYTRAVRRYGGRVHRAAYDYGSVVAGGACRVHDVVNRVGGVVARGCTAVHPGIVAVVTGTILAYLAGS